MTRDPQTPNYDAVSVLSPQAFRELVSGRRRGLVAICMRGALRVVSWGYRLGVYLRNRSFDRGKHVHRVGCPVISIGNLTLGGTGKTPMVAYVAQYLRNLGIRVTIVSRGYGAEQGALNDEAKELEEMLPDVPHVQQADRVAAAKMAVEEFECQCVIMDDGFQHRRLARDLDVVLIDALEPFGYGYLFPRGLLREPLSNLRRAEFVVLSRADQIPSAELDRIKEQVRRRAPAAKCIEVRHAPEGLLKHGDDRLRPVQFAGERIAAFCAIGNPKGFAKTLHDCGAHVVSFREFPDHHVFQADEIRELAAWGRSSGATMLVCTHKDLVKIGVDALEGTPLWALAIRLRVTHGEELLSARLSELVRSHGADESIRPTALES